MGNSLDAVPHALELRLSPLQIELPLGRGGWRCVVFARLSVFGEPDSVREAPWDQAIPINLPHEQAVLLISLYAKVDAEGNEQFLTEVCLPYSGDSSLVELGIRPGGPPVPLRLALTPNLRIDRGTLEELAGHLRRAREGVRSDKPCLALSVREVQIERRDSERLPQSPQNAAIPPDSTASLHERQKLGTDWVQVPRDQPCGSFGQLSQLQIPQHSEERLPREAAALAHERLEHAGSVSPQSTGREGSQRGWDKTLHIMHQELTNCQERQQKIREMYEVRIQSLESQLHKVTPGSNELEMTFDPQMQDQQQQVQRETSRVEQHINETEARRQELMRCWRQAKELSGRGLQHRGTVRAPESSAELQRLRTSMTWNEGQLRDIHRELRALQECMCEHTASEAGHEFEDAEHAHGDEGKEARDLFVDHDMIKERLEGAHSELYQLRSKIDALRDAGGHSNRAELNSLRYENEQKAKELQKMRDLEESRKQRIKELKLEQEALVEKLQLKSALPFVADNGPEQYAKALERKAQDLSEELLKVQDACQERQAEISRLRHMAADAHASSEALRKAYQDLKQSQEADAPGSARAAASDFSIGPPSDA